MNEEQAWRVILREQQINSVIQPTHGLLHIFSKWEKLRIANKLVSVVYLRFANKLVIVVMLKMGVKQHQSHIHCTEGL